MNTDKVLALAREAKLAVTISSHDSLHKFAALLRREIGADALAALVEAVQQEHGGDITNPRCPICIAINAFNKEKNNG
ncbi:hypothetical protein UFOVP1469_8 [uncultured Caudovirales phage]|uniref:Uncharacterized protein n=1 Tax=uncultured Caudovirales phage TaxID=2100421 RepID=A0A6J5SKJ8_9CAUD|nr:hypothetical protein UFOVP1469_8 [uncultured Caudovirales phage]CAB5229368.1 hypothetical protein UFOVP1556_43 [uncultured Caudovirales phage]